MVIMLCTSHSHVALILFRALLGDMSISCDAHFPGEFLDEMSSSSRDSGVITFNYLLVLLLLIAVANVLGRKTRCVYYYCCCRIGFTVVKCTARVRLDDIIDVLS